jgi:fructose-bisphosphate aldolase class I
MQKNYRQELVETCKAICCPGKGILAADESHGTIGKKVLIKFKFLPLNIENIEENRRTYRELLFTTDNLESYISGVILFDETTR